MSGAARPRPPGGPVRFPALALVSLLILLLAGAGIALFSERAHRIETAREAGAQADLLASAVAGALAFDDPSAAQDYVDAVQINPNVLTAGVYDAGGRLVAGFARPGQSVPARAVRDGPIDEVVDGALYVVRPVSEGGQYLGTVRIRMTPEPLMQKVTRYLGLGLLLVMALLVILVLGASQAALRRANEELQARAAALAESNRRLHDEMEERARAEEAMRQSQKMEAVGRLTGGVAHDFNNLLMVASSGIDLLDRTTDPAKRAKLRDGIRQAVDRGATLTRQLLAFSRRSALTPRVLDLRLQIEGMRVLLERSLRENIAVEIDLPEDLWPVEVDASELELALLNVAVNARDAMPNGGVLRITGENVRGDAGGTLARDHVRISVSDTGVGLSPEQAARVFEPFFTTKPVGKGTGLGLSQVYGFAQSSGGEVAFESAEGQGATVRLCLPRSDKPLSEAETDSVPRAPIRGRGRILMVEDDDGVAQVVAEMLRQLGYRVTRADSAAEALATLARDARFDLVFSDMVMPGEMDGRALAREIRTQYPGLPVLLTTGYSEAAAQAAAEGLTLLPKPYRLEALGAAIHAARRGGGGEASGAS